MNTMTKISTLYANYTIQTNDKKYIIKEDTMQRPASQFYQKLETSEELKKEI